MKELLDCGQIVNTHGIRGEVRVVPWADSPEFLCRLPALYIGGAAVRVLSSRVHKGSVIAKLDGVDTVEKAMALKGKTVQLHRADAKLPDGAFFLEDIIGLDVVDGDGRRLDRKSTRLNSSH